MRNDSAIDTAVRCLVDSFQRIGYSLLVASATFAGGLASNVAGAQDAENINQDIEVFFTQTDSGTAKPNVLFILDTSQSMYSLEPIGAPVAFDPDDAQWDTTTPCQHDKFYYAKQGDGIPSCLSSAAIDPANFQCTEWSAGVMAAPHGFETRGPLKVAQETSTGKWATISQIDKRTVCEGDGDFPLPVGLNWNAKGKNAIVSNTYTFYRGDYLNYLAGSGGGDKYRIDIMREAIAKVLANTRGIKAGLMRYGYEGSREFLQQTATACEVLPDADESNKSSNGAPIMFPITDLDSGTAIPGFELSKDSKPGESPVQSQLRYQLGVDKDDRVIGWVVDPSQAKAARPFETVDASNGSCSIPLMAPGGRSPIGGAMQEAHLYYAGKQWSNKFGETVVLGSGYRYPSVPQSRVNGFSGGEQYDSPVEDACGKNYIVLLSDGTTEQDGDIDPEVGRLPGFKAVTGNDKCDDEEHLKGPTPPGSMCVDDMAAYMLGTDHSTSVAGLNNVITHAVGLKLGQDAAANSARQLLIETANRGGGEFVEAQNSAELEFLLTDVLRRILTENTSFSAPAVTVNAFNRTQHLNELYMSLFRPSFDHRWVGNLKKYQLDPISGNIEDADGAAAVDPASGFFLAGARSFWSAGQDGNDITKGGAAGEIDPATRKIYTNLSDDSDVALVDSDVSDITDGTVLGIQAGDKALPAGTVDLSVDVLKDWVYGLDVADADSDATTTVRLDMGDPLHARPVTVIYGGTAANPDIDDAAVFTITNDSFLHSFDPGNGSENWAFIPGDQLGRMRDLYYNPEVPDLNPKHRGYGLDGNIRVLQIDHNRNGIIESDPSGPDDQVILVFGKRRGGPDFYAVDVTNKNSPRLLWRQNYTSYGAGQSWSSLQPMRIRLPNDTNPTLAFAVGGGYDIREDQQPAPQPVSPEPALVGNRVLIVNALTGAVIWWAGNTASADLNLAQMDRPIPSDVRAIDLTGDGLTDRMYASDLGGRLWRFDIFNGKNVSGAEGDRLVEGGLLASLGNAEDVTPTAANTIRFFYAPDPALITRPGPNFINVAIGSGHREMPASDKTTVNWFFSVRDYNVLTPLLSSAYQADCSSATGLCHQILTEDDLADLTDVVGAAATAAVPVAVPAGAAGWRIQLEETGEKVLAESRTFQENVFFTTYAPRETGTVADTCGIKFGVNRLYVLNAVDARPEYNYDAQTGESKEDRSKELAQGSIAPEVVFIFPTPEPDPNNPNPPAPPPLCLVGLESCGVGLANPPVRTYWRQVGGS